MGIPGHSDPFRCNCNSKCGIDSQFSKAVISIRGVQKNYVLKFNDGLLVALDVISRVLGADSRNMAFFVAFVAGDVVHGSAATSTTTTTASAAPTRRAGALHTLILAVADKQEVKNSLSELLALV